LIIIGEKINGAIGAVSKAIAARDADFIRARAVAQAEAGSHYIDCAPSTAPEVEYEAMVWLIDVIQSAVETPISLDSPDASLLRRILDEGLVKKPGLVNSVNEEGRKCETIFPIIAGTDWNVIGLTCDQGGIPTDTGKKVDIAKRMIDKADKFGLRLSNFHIDPCVMALSTCVSSMVDFEDCARAIREYCPEVKITGAISNISFEMPARKYVNYAAMSYAIAAGLYSAICDPCDKDMMGAIYASEALRTLDKGGRKYNRAYRQGRFGVKK
jgi:5-methyltetrahydrofolate--homocysteine methyltransferase